jgi:hypothetical protein
MQFRGRLCLQQMSACALMLAYVLMKGPLHMGDRKPWASVAQEKGHSRQDQKI